jgi:hypothetical protein
MTGMTVHGESVWKLALGVLVLVFFFCIGVAHVIAPDYFIKRSAVRKGGELLTEFNRLGFQILGALIALFAAGVFYEIAKDLFKK